MHLPGRGETVIANTPTASGRTLQFVTHSFSKVTGQDRCSLTEATLHEECTSSNRSFEAYREKVKVDTQLQIGRTIFSFLVATLFTIFCNGTASTENITASAQSKEPLAALGGYYRLGRWLGIPVERFQKSEDDVITIETRDGHGIPVRYDNVVEQVTKRTGKWIYLTATSEAAPIDIYRNGELLERRRLPEAGPVEQGATLLPANVTRAMIF
ncbi:MAG: hypothetical protein AAF664_17665, partial [Planctomycetota bacterium]